MITAREYREIEARLDDALTVFDDPRLALTAEDREILNNLIEVRKEVHELRIQQETEIVA